MKFKGL